MPRTTSFPPAADRHRRFTVVQNSRGQWVAREGHGMVEGVFRRQRDAVRFALFECGAPGSVVVIAGGAPPAGANS